MLLYTLVLLESPTVKHIIQIFYFYDYVNLQLKCVRNESVISFSEKILAGNRSDLVRIVLVTLWYAYEDFTLYL